MNRGTALTVASAGMAALLLAGALAPEFLPVPELGTRMAPPWEAPPLGRDDRGIPLHLMAMQGAGIVAGPALMAAVTTAVCAGLAGWIRCQNLPRLDGAIQAVGEVLGSLPRLVVVLVAALLIPPSFKGLMPVAVVWTVLSLPAAMDEAAVAAARLGGARFVEALRAHGFSQWRIYGIHILGTNLRPILVRQAAEVASQVVFLEIALSYLAVARNEPSFTHRENLASWANLLYLGYTALLGQPLLHALVLAISLLAAVVGCAHLFVVAARAR